MAIVPNWSSDLFIYVEPDSGSIDAMFFVTLVGVTMRQNDDWEAVFDQKIIDNLTDGRDCYVLNWDKLSGNEPLDVPDDYDDEHEAVYLFDKGELNKGNLNTWFDLAYKAGEGITSTEEE
jgi:hypothetical protein